MPIRPSREKMTVLYAGRLVPYKCPDVIVTAFASSRTLRSHRLVIVGDGPERPAIEELIRQHGLSDCVSLLGWLDHEDVLRQMDQADVFAFPSVRELGAGVVTEAMGRGLPCVVVDYGGPARYIQSHPKNGIKIPLSDKGQLVESYRSALEELVSLPEQCRAMGESAFHYVQNCHTWDVRAARICQLYEYLAGAETQSPDFMVPSTSLGSPHFSKTRPSVREMT
ncbi:MAG: glycosyltransferase [Pirellulaceae bacterium]